ncbi:RES family NAD+ phosphorylase [Brevundimonas diminuta]
MGEPTEYSEDISYTRRRADTRDLQEDWAALETELKTKHRFFSHEAETLFGRLFAGLHAMKTVDGRPVVRTIGPGTDLTALFRARAFQSNARFEEALIDPEQFVGTPASKFAMSGRMNPLGVAVFYGATSEALALAEVRPPVGSRVLTGRFDVQRELRILDVDALESVLVTGSLFDPAFTAQEALGAFLEHLAARIRMPVMPDDEATDYLITQVMADYLAARVAPRIDGVAYSSAQGAPDAFNVALFNWSARVKAADIVMNATHEVNAYGDDDIETYSVWTEVDPPAAAPIKPKKRGLFEYVAPLDEGPEDLRLITLILDRESMSVHRVRRIEVKTDTVEVHRHTMVRGDDPF